VDPRFRLGAGWAHTFTSGGPDRDNVFGEIGFNPGRVFDAGLRLGYVPRRQAGVPGRKGIEPLREHAHPPGRPRTRRSGSARPQESPRASRRDSS
jgi:hypothetical protein